MARKAFYITHLRFILLEQCFGMTKKRFFIQHTRFIFLDKTWILLGMTRKTFCIPHPHFILLDMTWKTRFIRIHDIHPSSVTHPSVRPSVRYSSVRPYPRFILTVDYATCDAKYVNTIKMQISNFMRQIFDTSSLLNRSNRLYIYLCLSKTLSTKICLQFKHFF